MHSVPHQHTRYRNHAAQMRGQERDERLAVGRFRAEDSDFVSLGRFSGLGYLLLPRASRP